MNKFAVQRRCAVCGSLLPEMSHESLVKKGHSIQKSDGSVIWHCGQHTPKEVSAARNGVPKFKTYNRSEQNDKEAV
jgi:hypothetical protein